jgi:hypothetical protein
MTALLARNTRGDGKRHHGGSRHPATAVPAFHQPLGGKGDPLTQDVDVGGRLNAPAQGHPLGGQL